MLINNKEADYVNEQLNNILNDKKRKIESSKNILKSKFLTFQSTKVIFRNSNLSYLLNFKTKIRDFHLQV